MSAVVRAAKILACSAQRTGQEGTTNRVRLLNPIRPVVTGLVLVSPLSVVAVTAPGAHADAVDSNFLNALQSRGITFASGQAAVAAGHQVCDALDDGGVSSDVAKDVMQQSGLDGYHAGFFVGVSVAAFCPRHTGV